VHSVLAGVVLQAQGCECLQIALGWHQRESCRLYLHSELSEYVLITVVCSSL
jgi:hypothetical protein